MVRFDGFEVKFGFHVYGFGCFVFRMYPTILPSIVSLGERTPLDFVSAINPMALENLPAPSSCSSVCFMSSVLFDCTDNLDWGALASLNKLSLSDLFLAFSL